MASRSVNLLVMDVFRIKEVVINFKINTFMRVQGITVDSYNANV